VTALLSVLFTLTTTFTGPFVRPDGTVAVIDVPLLLQFVVAATTVPNLTVLVPFVEPKPVPVIVTDMPDAPEIGLRLEITGAAKSDALARTTNKKQATELSGERLEHIHPPLMCA